jgi:uridine kinase
MMHQKPFLIGIAGGTGSGKTTLARKLVAAYGSQRVSVIDSDAYYKDLSHLSMEQRRETNFDHPDAIDSQILADHLQLLRKGFAIEKFCYDFTTHTRIRESVKIEPTAMVIVEGILILAIDKIRNLFDVRIFIDEKADIRLLRRIRRDMKERGRSLDMVVDQYLSSVRPMYIRYVEPTKQFAHVIFQSGDSTDDLMAYLNKRMEPTL